MLRTITIACIFVGVSTQISNEYDNDGQINIGDKGVNGQYSKIVTGRLLDFFENNNFDVNRQVSNRVDFLDLPLECDNLPSYINDGAFVLHCEDV